jgi:signal transduction histidine kinase/CheY-like chemotaxis protein
MKEPKSKATLNPDQSVIQEENSDDFEDESISANFNPNEN